MVHQDTSTSPPSVQVKQVEFNTIAASFGGLSAYTSKLHKSVQCHLIFELINTGNS
jgi:glutathione synthase